VEPKATALSSRNCNGHGRYRCAFSTSGSRSGRPGFEEIEPQRAETVAGVFGRIEVIVVLYCRLDPGCFLRLALGTQSVNRRHQQPAPGGEDRLAKRVDDRARSPAPTNGTTVRVLSALIRESGRAGMPDGELNTTS